MHGYMVEKIADGELDLIIFQCNRDLMCLLASAQSSYLKNCWKYNLTGLTLQYNIWHQHLGWESDIHLFFD